MHYHMMSGVHGYMPDNAETYDTKDDAMSGLIWFVDTIKDEAYQEDEHACAITYKPGDDYAEFPCTDGIAHPTHGVEYAAVTACTEPDCTTDE